MYATRNSPPAVGLQHATTPGGTTVSVPCGAFFDRAGDGRLRSMRVLSDLTPLFAQLGAEASVAAG